MDIMIKALLCVVACAVPLASYAETPKVSNGVMVDGDGMTLYTFDKDTETGKSACAGECATIWPAAKERARNNFPLCGAPRADAVVPRRQG
jgi:predicted lipoprotein with Yx(FWY)xxD motif